MKARIPRRLLLATFVGVSALFFVARGTLDLVWNDTVAISEYRFYRPDQALLQHPNWLSTAVEDAFGGIGSSGYRPLERLVGRLAIGWFGTGPLDPRLFLAAAALLIGATSVAFLSVAHRYLNSARWSVVAVLLFVCSPAFLTGSLVFLVSIQAFVPLILCLVLLTYWKYVDLGATPSRIVHAAILAALLFLGPWYKEFLGLAALLVIFSEVRRARRPTPLSVLALLAFLHALHPTVLVRLIAFPDLPLANVFSMGSLGEVMDGGHDGGSPLDRIASALRHAKWEVSFFLPVLLPPSLLLIGYAGFLLQGKGAASIALKLRSDRPGPSHDRTWSRLVWGRWSGALLLFLLCPLVTGALLLPFLSTESTATAVLGLWLVLGLAIFALAIDSLLAVWFLLSIVPFYKVFTEIVHLMYAAAPAAIIVTAGTRLSWDHLKKMSPQRGLRRAFALLVGVLVADQVLTVYGVWRVTRASNEGIKAVGAALEERVPAGAVVVSNVLHAYDIQHFLDGHIDVRYTVAAGAPPYRVVDDTRELASLVGARDEVYFLDVLQDYHPLKLIYHSHKYVRDRSTEYRYLGLLHRTQVVYPFVDPLRNFIRRPFVPFLGAPDLVNDFYHGRAQSGTPFLNEVNAEYHLYRVMGEEVRSWHPEGPPRLVEEGLGGYNVLEWNGRYFAVPQAAGPIDLQKLLYGDYEGVVVGSDLDAVRKAVRSQVSGSADPF